MGLLMDLPKEHNSLYHDFTDAYWAIAKVSFGSQGGDGSVMTSFEFAAFPTRESKKATETFQEATSLPTFGGPIYGIVDSCIYRWMGMFRASDIFADGIPTTTAGQLALLYPFVKRYLDLVDVVDVLEEE